MQNVHADKDKNKVSTKYIGKYKLWFPGLEKLDGQMLRWTYNQITKIIQSDFGSMSHDRIQIFFTPVHYSDITDVKFICLFTACTKR